MADALGNRIRALRGKKRLTQQELADLVGLSRSAVAQWENGHSSPGTEVLAALAKALSTSIDGLLGARAS